MTTNEAKRAAREAHGAPVARVEVGVRVARNGAESVDCRQWDEDTDLSALVSVDDAARMVGSGDAVLDLYLYDRAGDMTGNVDARVSGGTLVGACDPFRCRGACVVHGAKVSP